MWERVMKMKIEIRNDKAVVSGYVNAVGRDSRPITDVRGKFVEQIEPGAFRASLERSENVDLLLNHDKSKVYASTKDGNLKLIEDSIGLRAEAVLTDAEMIRKARSGEFRGWSFGMYVGDSAMEERAEGIPRRHVKSLNMFEVSLIDKSRIPCYVGTSVECRSDGEILAELRYSEEEPEIVEEERSEPESVDYSAVDNVISELRYGAVDNVIAELRYNPYHDPSNGRFTSGGGGGGGGVLVVEQGQKGKGYYVVDKNNGEDFDDEEYDKWKSEKQSVSNSNDGTPKRFVNNQGWWSRRMKTDYDEIEDKVNKTQSMNVLFRYRNAATQNQTAIKKEIALADINRDPNINTVRLRQYDRKYDSLIKHIDDRIMNDKRLKVSASRSFDPIDSKLEELRSSDPAD